MPNQDSMFVDFTDVVKDDGIEKTYKWICKSLHPNKRLKS